MCFCCFFFKQKTAYEMRISDWSSDVCSSDLDMELLPWSRAIGLARERPMTCVFTTAHTVDRNAQFKWVEPLLVERTLLIRAAGSGVDPADLAAARSEERQVGNEGVGTCRSRWSPLH